MMAGTVMMAKTVIYSASKLRELHKSGELQLGDIVTLQDFTAVKIDKSLGRLVLRDFRKSEIQCFAQQTGLVDGIGYLSSVNAVGTYHPASHPETNDEFFRIYKIGRCS